MLVTGAWALSYGMGLVSEGHALEAFWYILMYTALIATPPTVFALSYQYKYQTDTAPRWAGYLWIIPALLWVSVLTDPLHSMFTGGIGWEFHNGPESGIFWWANVMYSYALIVGAIGLLITASEKWGQRYRTQSIALLISFMTPFLVSLISITWSLPRYNLDFTPLATASAGLLLALAMFRYGLFRSVPIAREILVDLTSDGMVVVDRDNKIIDYNDAATRLLDVAPKCLGCPIVDYVPDWSANQPATRIETHEFVTKSSDGSKVLKINISPIHQQGGSEPGARLAVIRDISAEVAVIAIEQQARKRAEIEASYTASIGQSLNYEEIVAGMLSTAREVSGADYAIFLSFEPGSTDCVLEASSGTEFVPGDHAAIAMCAQIRNVPLFSRLVETGEPIVVSDALAEPDLASPGHMLMHLRSVLAVRMESWRDRTGALVLGSATPDAFTSSDASRVMTLANVAAGAIQNAEQLHTIEAQAEVSEVEGAKLRSILDALLDPLVVLEPVYGEFGSIEDFTIADLNELAREFQGVPRKDIIGRPISQLQPDTLRNGLLERFADAMKTRTAFYSSALAWGTLDGSPVYADVRAVPFATGVIVNWRDVTERRSAEEEIRESEQRFRLLAENSLSAVIRISDERIVTWASPSLHEALGWVPEEVVGKPLIDFVHPDDIEALAEADHEPDVSRSHVTRLRMVDPGGLFHWAEMLSRSYTNASGQPEGAIASLRTVDEEVAIEQELERRARYDELTGVLNRRAVMERVVETARRGARTGQHAAIMFCDLDKLKDTNDSHGHLGGDRLIKTVAQRMVAALRETDTVGRFGGDEFLVLLEGIHDLVGAAKVADKVRVAVSLPIKMADGSTLEPGISIGVTIMGDGEEIDEVIERANRGLFGAKRAGRDQVVTVSAEGEGE